MGGWPATAQPAAAQLGPVQMLVFELEQERLAGEIFPALMALAAKRLIRLIDVLVVFKPGDNAMLEVVDSRTVFGEDADLAGELVAALIGLRSASEHMRARDAIDGFGGDDDDNATWDIADRIPPDAHAAILLLEHVWAIPLRNAVGGDRGIVLADEWVHPDDLRAIGVPPPGPIGTDQA
jgi:hypothetical protein